MKLWTRRSLLKHAGTLAAALALAPFTNLGYLFADEAADAQPMDADQPPAPLGRITTWRLAIREAPRRNAKLVRYAYNDEVLALLAQAVGDPLLPHNPVWYKVEEGWLHSSFVQPVRQDFQVPEPALASQGFWAQVTVPFTEARAQPSPHARRVRRLYYTSVYRVSEAAIGEDGQWWYRIGHGLVWSNAGPYVPASHLRRIPPEELMPVHPEVLPDQKRIEVDLRRQIVTAYEGDRVVLTARAATGFGRFQTPRGQHRIIRKRMSSRMIGGEGRDFYDLPGVPFPAYFTATAVAFHGAYWHNDFGRQRSHGCVNLPTPVAQWIWRWTLPPMGYNEIEMRRNDPSATRVIVF